jgi:cytochrome c oxidase assembly protein subunit 15
MEDTATKLESEKSIMKEEDFSPLKSRIEYVNRIVGVVIGLMISLVLLRSFKFVKTRPLIFIAALVAWLSVVFTGWFGSIVVSTNLTPWTVSVHLGFAMLIVGLLVYLYQSASETTAFKSTNLNFLVWICLAFSIIQMVLGIQVREALDQIAFTVTNRDSWISSLGTEFIIHRSFSWLVFLSNGFLSYKLMKNFGQNWRTTALAGLTLGSVVTGVGMAYLSVPAFLQPFHLLFSALTFGILFLMLLENRKATETVRYA